AHCPCCFLSPMLLITPISPPRPVAANNFLRTDSACHLASTLPRVPIRRILTASPGKKETGRAALRRFEFSDEVPFRHATAPRAPRAVSPASHPSVFRRAPVLSPSGASWIPCARG